MLIAGFQPLTLLDYPGIISSIVFTQGCPLRCVYCHNPDLLPTQTFTPERLLTEETVLKNLTQRKHIVEGVCITGGEPTIHHDLPVFIKKIKHLGLLVKLDTNGVHPRMIERLLDERLIDFIAMDLKHTWDKYASVIGINQPHVIKACRDTFDLIQTSSIPHEFRTTVYSALHTQHDLQTIAEQLHNGTHYALQDMRYEKTLQEHLPKTTPFDLETIANTLRKARPDLQIEVRS